MIARTINQAFNAQAQWTTPARPSTELSVQAKVTLYQLIVVVLVKALFCLSSIHSARRYFVHDPAAQQLIYRSLLGVLMIGDAFHLAATLYAVEPATRWQFGSWSTLMWATVGVDLSLFGSRVLWHFEVGRDVIPRSESTGKRKEC